jgi:hypothetical protein
VSEPAPVESRVFQAPNGARWEARVIARGPASAYLAARVSRPTVQLTRLDPPVGAPRYAALAQPRLADLSEADLVALLGRARIY